MYDDDGYPGIRFSFIYTESWRLLSSQLRFRALPSWLQSMLRILLALTGVKLRSSTSNP
jgi:hypothetical protein